MARVWPVLSACFRSSRTRLKSRRARRPFRLELEFLEDRTLPSITLPFPASIIDPNDIEVAALVAPAEQDVYQLNLVEFGRLTARVQADNGLDTRLSFVDADGEILAQNNSGTPAAIDELVFRHLGMQREPAAPRTIYVMVEGIGVGTGSYTITTEFVLDRLAAQPLPASVSPELIVRGNFDVNQTPDIATLDDFQRVVVQIGRGDGTFRTLAPKELPLGGVAMVAGDFNGDFITDLAVLSEGDGVLVAPAVTILRGIGDGTFLAPLTVSFALTSQPIKLAAGDFDGDGITDLATVNAGSADVSIILGNGSGVYQLEAATLAAPANASALVVADFNGDFNLDLALAGAGPVLWVLLGQGNGQFSAPVEQPLAHVPTAMAAADVNRDGRADLILAHGDDSAAGEVVVLLANADGTFQESQTIAAGVGPVTIVTDDFDLDGYLDLAVWNFFSSDVSTYVNDRSGAFGFEHRVPIDHGVRGLLTQDVNGYGGGDLVLMTEAGPPQFLKSLGSYYGPFAPIIDRQGVLGASLLADQFDVYQLTLTESGRLTIHVHADRSAGGTLETRLYLLGTDAQVLVQSDARALDDADDFIIQHVDSGGLQYDQFEPSERRIEPRVYYVIVESLGGAGNYTITTEFVPANLPTASIQQLVFPGRLASGDFNRDGILDLATVDSDTNRVAVSLGLGDGTFRNQTNYETGLGLNSVVTGDFNGDGILDMAAANSGSDGSSVVGPGAVAFLLGRGDGTFRNRVEVAYPFDPDPRSTPANLVAGDFNGDGITDVATVNSRGGFNDVSLILGNRQESFQREANTFEAPINANAITAGDFNGDGILDLAEAGSEPVVYVLLGLGGALFGPRIELAVGKAPNGLVTGDFDGDGNLDLAVSNSNRDFGTFQATTGSMSVLLGNGDGSFQAQQEYGAGANPTCITASDFNGDGRVDLVVGNGGSSDVSIYVNQGNGRFAGQVRIASDHGAVGMVAGDFNRDGHSDLGLSTSNGPTQILQGLGDGNFQSPTLFATGAGADDIVTGDFNGDGRMDVATANQGTADVSILLGQGDGTFQDQIRLDVPAGAPSALVTADFNGDGRLDLAVASSHFDQAAQPLTGDLFVFLGLGNGTFREWRNENNQPLRYHVGGTPSSMQAADFDGDGFLDLAVVNSELGHDFFRPFAEKSGDVSILRGNGNGTFQAERRLAVATDAEFHFTPVALAIQDLDADGRLDVALALHTTRLADIDEYLRNRSEHPEQFFAPPAKVGYATVLMGIQGAFAPPMHFAAGESVNGIAAGDFNGDGHPDLALSDNGNTGDHQINWLLDGDGHGGFAAARATDAGSNPQSLITADINQDGKLDLITPGGNNAYAAVILGSGDGTFNRGTIVSIDGVVVAVAAADFNGDSLKDVAVVSSGRVAVGLAGLSETGGNLFLQEARTTTNIQSTPQLADVNGDGTVDSIVINRAGEVLVRLGDPNVKGLFAAAIVVNPLATAAGEPTYREARAVTPVRAGSEVLLATVDAVPTPVAFIDYRGVLIDNLFAYTVSLYAVTADGHPVFRGETQTIPAPPTLFQHSVLLTMPTRIVSGNFNRDAPDDFDDLAVLMPLSNPRVALLVADGMGGFGHPGTTDLGGIGPIDFTHADLNDDGTEDLVTTNQLSGEIVVLFGDGSGFFFNRLQYRTGTGLYSTINPSYIQVSTADETRGVMLVDVNNDGLLDVVAPAAGGNAFSVLLGRGLGSFTNPRSHQLDFSPSLVAAGRFNDDAFADLVFLNADDRKLVIFLGDGAGGFTAKQNIIAGKLVPLLAGNLPSGLSTADVNGDSKVDVQVGNDFGDVLTLFGNGDGTFQPQDHDERTITLAQADLNGDGFDDFVYGNESLDRVTVQYSQGSQTFINESEGVDTPGEVRLADLNRDGLLDLIVASGGFNQVRVFLGVPPSQGGELGAFGSALEFFVGNDPVGISVRDLDGDGILDLVVANQGSNDVSILLGQGQGDSWTLAEGPRLPAGGTAPTSTTVEDVTGDGVPDLLVVNEHDVTLLPGVSNGFFNPQNPTVFPAGTLPSQALVGNFDGAAGLDLLVLNGGAGTMTFFSNLSPQSGITLSSGGLFPSAAIEGDFNKDGFDDLVVANNGDGKISLFFGGKGGLELVDSQESEGLLHPSALAFCSLDGDGLKVYLTDEGEESITRLTFNLDFGDVAPTGLPGTPPNGDVTDLAESRPFAEVTDALIAALLAEAALAGSDETTEKSDTNADEEDKPSQQNAGLRGLIQTLFGAESQVLEDWGTEILDELSAVLDVTTDVVRNLLQKVFEELNISWNPFANGAAQPANNEKEAPAPAPSMDFDKPLVVHIPKEESLSSAPPRLDAESTPEARPTVASDSNASSPVEEDTRCVVERCPISPRMADAFFRRFSMAAVMVSAFTTLPLVVLNSRKPNLREMGWAWFSANRR